MNTPAAKMLVLIAEKYSCIKIIGRANFTSSVDFRTVVNELRLRGFSCFVLELSECALMDSTFLGVLTGLGLKLNPTQLEGADGAIELLNASPRITELLENLGVLHLFKLTHGLLQPPQGCEALDHTPCNPSKEEVTQTCLEAHRTLMEVNPDNVCRFKDVTRFLAEDLKRLKTRAEQPTSG